MRSLGKSPVLLDNYYRGKPVLGIMRDLTVYERRNGSLFACPFIDSRRRATVTRREDGSFYMRLDKD